MTDNLSPSTNPETQIEQTTAAPEPPTYFVVLVSEFDAPQVLTFNSPESVAEAIKDYKQTDSKFYAFVFEGKRWMITRGKFRHIVSPDSSTRLALYNEEDDTYSDNGLID